jgi:hypothetical protein
MTRCQRNVHEAIKSAHCVNQKVGRGAAPVGQHFTSGGDEKSGEPGVDGCRVLLRCQEMSVKEILTLMKVGSVPRRMEL